MPRYFCDYCDIYLTHKSASARSQHQRGAKHREAFKSYFQGVFMKQQQLQQHNDPVGMQGIQPQLGIQPPPQQYQPRPAYMQNARPHNPPSEQYPQTGMSQPPPQQYQLPAYMQNARPHNPPSEQYPQTAGYHGPPPTMN